jgi:hypothetical protein
MVETPQSRDRPSPPRTRTPNAEGVYALRVAGGDVPPAALEIFETASGAILDFTTLSADAELAALNGLMIALRDIGLELVGASARVGSNTPARSAPRDLPASYAEPLSLLPLAEWWK